MLLEESLVEVVEPSARVPQTNLAHISLAVDDGIRLPGKNGFLHDGGLLLHFWAPLQLLVGFKFL